jgi:hypothetical protein
MNLYVVQNKYQTVFIVKSKAVPLHAMKALGGEAV